MAVSYLGPLMADHTQRRARVDPRVVRVGFEVNKVADGRVYPRLFLFFNVRIIPSVLYNHSVTLLGPYIA
jgi:hypothetical protein